MRASEKGHGTLRSDLVILIGVAGVIYLIGSITDFAESFWSMIQAFEAVELDELIVAMVAMLAGGFVVAVRRISALETKVTNLTTNSEESPLSEALNKNHIECVIKCVGCGKYQIHGDRWFSADEFANYIQKADAFGGVCPSCRVSSSD